MSYPFGMILVLFIFPCQETQVNFWIPCISTDGHYTLEDDTHHLFLEFWGCSEAFYGKASYMMLLSIHQILGKSCLASEKKCLLLDLIGMGIVFIVLYHWKPWLLGFLLCIKAVTPKNISMLEGNTDSV